MDRKTPCDLKGEVRPPELQCGSCGQGFTRVDGLKRHVAHYCKAPVSGPASVVGSEDTTTAASSTSTELAALRAEIAALRAEVTEVTPHPCRSRGAPFTR